MRLSSFRYCCFLWRYNHVLCSTAEAEFLIQDKYNLISFEICVTGGGLPSHEMERLPDLLSRNRGWKWQRIGRSEMELLLGPLELCRCSRMADAVSFNQLTERRQTKGIRGLARQRSVLDSDLVWTGRVGPRWTEDENNYK